MSIRIMSRVWDGFPGGGSDLLAMLALADWSDDEGRCFPSIPSIARKIRLSPDQARRVVHRLIEGQFVRVLAGTTGGGMSRRYQINLDALTPCTDATPGVDARGGVGASPPLASAPGDPLHSYASRTVIEPSVPVREVAQALPSTLEGSKSKKAATTLKAFIEQCQANEVQPITESDPIFAYAEKVGIDREMLAVAWTEFKAYWMATQSRKCDWPGTFRNAVRQNRAGLWYLKSGEPARWTTAGEQARRAAA